MKLAAGMTALPEKANSEFFILATLASWRLISY